MNKVLSLIGIILALTGAFFLKESCTLGERTITAAIRIDIVGIWLIATSSPWKVK